MREIEGDAEGKALIEKQSERERYRDKSIYRGTVRERKR